MLAGHGLDMTSAAPWATLRPLALARIGPADGQAPAPEGPTQGGLLCRFGRLAARNRITDVIRVTSPRITLRLYAIGPHGAGGAQGNEMRRLRAGRGAPADSVSGWAGCLLSGLRLPALPVRPAVKSAAVPPRPATAQAVPGSTTRLSPGAPISGRSPGRLAGPAYQHPAPPTVSGSAAPLAGHCAGQPRRGGKRGRAACGRATRRRTARQG